MDSTSTIDWDDWDYDDYDDFKEPKWTDVYKSCEHCDWDGHIHWKRIKCPKCKQHFKDYKKKLKIKYWNLERPTYTTYTE